MSDVVNHYRDDYPHPASTKAQSDPIDCVTLYGSGITSPELYMEWLNDEGSLPFSGRSSIFVFMEWRENHKQKGITLAEYVRNKKSFDNAID